MPRWALRRARHADDHALAAEILAAQAHQALYLARPDEAVDLARAAQAAAVRHGSATLLTECLVMEAHGHAARNDASACGAALARAEQAFDRAAREDDPAWLSVIPARMPGAEHRADERAGGPRPLRPPGKRHGLPDPHPSHQ